MKRLLTLIAAVSLLGIVVVEAQIYAKLNTLYAVVGVINPQVEAVIAPKSSFVVDAAYSPWKSINGKHANFGILQAEYRYYFKETARGWYLSGNVGMIGYDINKPKLFDGGLLGIIDLKTTYSKGFGVMVGVGAGYQYSFAKRWVLDVYLALDYMRSWYNGYQPDGTVIMVPYGHEDYEKPDPFNGSSEIFPTKVGVSIGYKLFSPKK